MNIKVIGILGTAKNTGKTTTLNFLLEWLSSEGIEAGLTSIGYDGEDIDNITGLPKPNILVQKNNIIATAEQCILPFKDNIKIIENTSLKTSLGQIVIGRMKKDGLAVLAGPNKGKDLQMIIQKLKEQNTGVVLVDGALSRMVPLINCDALILATGASRNTNIDFLVDEVESIFRAFSLPLSKEEDIFYQEGQGIDKNNITIIKKNRYYKQINDHSLLGLKTFNNLINIIDEKESEEIYIPGIIHDNFLKKIANKHSLLFQGKTIIINNPAFLLIGSRDIGHLKDLIDDILDKGIKLKTLYKLPILAVTINPFYPKYSRYGKNNYEEAYINEEQLFQEMKKRVPFPVINIKKESSTKLKMIIKKVLNICSSKNA